jgi:cytochrome b
MGNERQGGIDVPVWDLPVRLFHWLLVALLGFSWWSAENGHMDWHMRSGYAVLALVLFRIVWGFVGSTTARFVDFVRGPAEVLDHLRQLFARDAPPHAGHNPLGGLSVVLMLAVMLVQAASGLFASDDILTEGPLYRYVSGATAEWLTSIHRANFDLLLALVVIHVAAIAFYRLYKRQDLVTPMVTGRKRLAAGTPTPRVGIRSPLIAAVVLAACAALVWLLVTR